MYPRQSHTVPSAVDRLIFRHRRHIGLRPTMLRSDDKQVLLHACGDATGFGQAVNDTYFLDIGIHSKYDLHAFGWRHFDYPTQLQTGLLNFSFAALLQIRARMLSTIMP
jgi:hypothetical protein